MLIFDFGSVATEYSGTFITSVPEKPCVDRPEEVPIRHEEY